MRKNRSPDKLVGKPIEMKITGYEVVEKRADSGGNSGRIYVPKSWIGKLIRAIRIER